MIIAENLGPSLTSTSTSKHLGLWQNSYFNDKIPFKKSLKIYICNDKSAIQNFASYFKWFIMPFKNCCFERLLPFKMLFKTAFWMLFVVAGHSHSISKDTRSELRSNFHYHIHPKTVGKSQEIVTICIKHVHRHSKHLTILFGH